ncbi:hypothetical protein [Xanthomonas phage BUDD]|nr:hypothetical protein [Xanthomonas phage BUDD]
MAIRSGAITVTIPQEKDTRRWDRTIRNWRWWVVFPIIFPLALMAFLLYPLHHVLWPVGQFICRVSNHLYEVKLPKWSVRIRNWAFKNFPESQR